MGFFGTEMVCKDCGFVGNLRKKNRGSELITLILLLFAILPGIIYMIWSFTNRTYRCPKCHGVNLIPTDSPIGKKLLQADAINTQEKVNHG